MWLRCFAWPTDHNRIIMLAARVCNWAQLCIFLLCTLMYHAHTWIPITQIARAITMEDSVHNTSEPTRSIKIKVAICDLCVGVPCVSQYVTSLRRYFPCNVPTTAAHESCEVIVMLDRRPSSSFKMRGAVLAQCHADWHIYMYICGLWTETVRRSVNIQYNNLLSWLQLIVWPEANYSKSHMTSTKSWFSSHQ